MDMACCTSSRRKIFPAGDLGIAETKASLRTFLYGATCHKIIIDKSGLNLLSKIIHSQEISSIKGMTVPCFHCYWKVES